MEHTIQLSLPAPLTRFGRYLALAQQIKDTATILSLNLLLVFALPLALPGLVLYFVRWQFVRARRSRQRAAWVWGLTLVHEALCIWLFAAGSRTDADLADMHFYTYGYALGFFIAAAALCDLLLSGPGAVEEAPGAFPD